MMKLSLLFTLSCLSAFVTADKPDYPVAKVNYADYQELVKEVEAHRAKRLIDFDTFLEMSSEPGVVILDSRSKYRFDRLHLKGATHLNFSDFTQGRLRELIPDPDTVILIYCNNNFEGNEVDFTSKMLVPAAVESSMVSLQVSRQEKPRMMALNVPTYLNLYGYGYRNVYELHELVNVEDPRVEFEGSQAERGGPRL
jgi:rhodanese-related sulfurtransferase